MSETVIVSGRGQITLPAALRKRFGIKSGDLLILEDRGHEIVLIPVIVPEVQCYSNEQIAEWDAADRLSERDRTRMLDRLGGSG